MAIAADLNFAIIVGTVRTNVSLDKQYSVPASITSNSHTAFDE
jgi:hypothetical protein